MADKRADILKLLATSARALADQAKVLMRLERKGISPDADDPAEGLKVHGDVVAGLLAKLPAAAASTDAPVRQRAGLKRGDRRRTPLSAGEDNGNPAKKKKAAQRKAGAKKKR